MFKFISGFFFFYMNRSGSFTHCHVNSGVDMLEHNSLIAGAYINNILLPNPKCQLIRWKARSVQLFEANQLVVDSGTMHDRRRKCTMVSEGLGRSINQSINHLGPSLGRKLSPVGRNLEQTLKSPLPSFSIFNIGHFQRRELS